MLYQTDFEQAKTELAHAEGLLDNIADILADVELDGSQSLFRKNGFSVAVELLEEKEVRYKKLEDQMNWRSFLKEQLANRKVAPLENGLF